MRFMERIARFFYGRNGIDGLTIGLLVLYILLGGVMAFVNQSVALMIIRAVMLVLLALILFRTLSRNLAARQKENRKFMSVWDPIWQFLKRQWRRLREIKTHRYRKCPNCHVILRLPRRKGKHSVRCPKCGTTFKVHIPF